MILNLHPTPPKKKEKKTFFADDVGIWYLVKKTETI